MREIEYYDDELKQSMFNMDDNWYIDEPTQYWGSNCKIYREDDEFHRLDGPAIESVNGHKEWWINGLELTEEEFLKQQNAVIV